jgi:hypothetical protein
MHNIIAHELGHAIGLPHHNHPGALMCDGQIAPCQLLGVTGSLPLTAWEKLDLLEMYPATWKPDAPLPWKVT